MTTQWLDRNGKAELGKATNINRGIKMETINVKITGVSPMLMNSDRFSNPLDPMTKEHKLLTNKKKKTDEDYEAIALSSWRGSIYYDKSIGPLGAFNAVQDSERIARELANIYGTAEVAP